jgi:hypothetical protein
MKYFIGFLFIFFISVTTGYGGECDLEIRNGYAAQDLSRVLNCLQEKIIRNEQEILELKTRVKGGGEIIDPVRFSTGEIEVEVRSASRDEKGFNVGLSIKNRTTEKKFIQSETNKSVLVDGELGVPYRICRQEGLQYGYDYQVDEKEYTPILPNSHVNFTMFFCCDHVKTKSRLNNLTLCLLSLKNGNITKDTIPLKVIIK